MMFEGILVGVVSGVISAAVFHVIMKYTVPSISISDEIEERQGKNGKEYRIKIVNNRKRYVNNVKIYADLVHYENGPNGTVVRIGEVKVHNEDIPYIDPYDEKDVYCKYAVRCRFADDVLDMWKGDKQKHLQVRVFCTDEFSGAGKVFSKEYRQSSCVVSGSFKTGTSMEIVRSA